MKQTLKLAVGMLAAAGMVACGGAGSKQATGSVKLSIAGSGTMGASASSLKSNALSLGGGGPSVLQQAATLDAILVGPSYPAGTHFTLTNLQTAPITLPFHLPFDGDELIGNYTLTATIKDKAGVVLFNGSTSFVVHASQVTAVLLTLNQVIPGDTVIVYAPVIESIAISGFDTNGLPPVGGMMNFIADVDGVNCCVGDVYYDSKRQKFVEHPDVECIAFSFGVDLATRTLHIPQCGYAWTSTCSGSATADVFTQPGKYQTGFTSFCDAPDTVTFCVQDPSSAQAITFVDGIPIVTCGFNGTLPLTSLNVNCPATSCVSFTLPFAPQGQDPDLSVTTLPNVSCVQGSNDQPCPGAAITLTCLATEPDGSAISYAWSQKCDSGAGVFGAVPNGHPEQILWTAPNVLSDQCKITCTATGSGGSTAGTLMMQTTNGNIANGATSCSTQL